LFAGPFFCAPDAAIQERQHSDQAVPAQSKPPLAAPHPSHVPAPQAGEGSIAFCLPRERIRSRPELYDLGLCSFAAFDVKGRSVAEGRPQTLPSTGFRFVYAPVHAFIRHCAQVAVR